MTSLHKGKESHGYSCSMSGSMLRGEIRELNGKCKAEALHFQFSNPLPIGNASPHSHSF